MDILRSEGRFIVDKADDMTAQLRDHYDFVMDGDACEFKYDTRMSVTGNIAVEVVSNIGRGTPGWFITSTARWLFYMDTTAGICYQVDLPKLRGALDADNRSRYQAGKARTENKYSTFNWLVELGFVKSKECVAREIEVAA
jgi:hypothetical protein